jgi:hypothetical protein
MNWKRVLYLLRVDMKAGRLTRGQRLIKYNVTRNRLFGYLTYLIPIIIGLCIGLLVGNFYIAQSSDFQLQSLFRQGMTSLLVSLPTTVLVFCLIFTMLQQIQRSGVRFSHQIPYWLPVTWQEHTLASIVANVLGFPLISIALISATVVTFSLFVGQVALAVGSVLAMCAAAFMATGTTEVFRILQVRFVGAIYKSTGRAAVWVRFAGSIVFFIVFYVIYFYITSGANSLYFIQTIASGQSAIWFVPFVWLGLTLYSLMNGMVLQGAAFIFFSLLFIVGLFWLGTALNKRFGLYEPPAITISRGVYKPKSGFLGKIGFSSLEAALIRKDLKAFTRRRELITTFILPIVFLIIPIMTSVNGNQSSSTPSQFPSFMFVFTSLFPAALMAMSLGNFMTGEEGQNIWRLYSSPISAKNFVKSKYAFIVFFALLVLPITGVIGFLIYQPSLQIALTMAIESVFLVFTLGALSVANGIKGADFSEAPRPRMIRTEWAFINMLTCLAAGVAVLAPLVPYVLSTFVGIQLGLFTELYQAAIISGAIAVALTVIFYLMAVGNAKNLLSKAEV